MFWTHCRSPKWFCGQLRSSLHAGHLMGREPTEPSERARGEGRWTFCLAPSGPGGGRGAQTSRLLQLQHLSPISPEVRKIPQVSVFWGYGGEHRSVCHNNIENLWFCLKISPNPLNQKLSLCDNVRLWPSEGTAEVHALVSRVFSVDLEKLKNGVWLPLICP